MRARSPALALREQDAALDLIALVAQLFNPQLATPVHVTATRSLQQTSGRHGNVAYAGTLMTLPNDLPAQLRTTSRIGNKVLASQTVTFAYTGAVTTPIRLPG